MCNGSYADEATCSGSFICDFGGCALAPADAPMLVNAGEPGHPLIHDLTAEGFVTTDCVGSNDVAFPTTFPYLAAPHPTHP